MNIKDRTFVCPESGTYFAGLCLWPGNTRALLAPDQLIPDDPKSRFYLAGYDESFICRLSIADCPVHKSYVLRFFRSRNIKFIFN
jgi:hypothetical protein